MPATLGTLLYLVAGVLFILSLAGLSKQETASKGNIFGVLGMALAVLATAFDERLTLSPTLLGALLVGGFLGSTLAARVVMTAMPQLVALLHSFVGLAAVLVGISTALHPAVVPAAGSDLVHSIEIWLDVAIGAITFTGSVVAWGKLDGRVSGRPLLLPARHSLNLGALLAIVALAVPFAASGHSALGIGALLLMTLVAGALGVHLVLAIGGADMPVVVSLLNSYSGWTAAAAGFMLGNDALIVTGALVGSSGAILSYIMCKAMNRSIWHVVFAGFGTSDAAAPAGPVEDLGALVTRTSVEELARQLADARSVVIVPGYGMAVSRAQHAVEELTRSLLARGVSVRYAIHPVAGRLPGHMNVLLAEAGVPYDIVFEMDEVNDELPQTDIVLVIGANDVVNPAAETDTTSPIYGMPVLRAWTAGRVVVFKRSLGAGYAGVENPLFFRDNTDMLFGDARETVTALLAALR